MPAPRSGLPPGLAPWHPAAWLATWLFSGLLPVAPGTWGTLAALPFAWVIAKLGGGGALVIAALIAFVVGCWAARVYMRHGGAHDPGAIVIDEVAGLWLTLAVAPVDGRAYALGFLFFRLFDIVKPWPVSWLDRRVHGGFGVMIDDIAAAVYAAAALWLSTTYLLPLFMNL